MIKAPFGQLPNSQFNKVGTSSKINVKKLTAITASLTKNRAGNLIVKTKY